MRPLTFDLQKEKEMFLQAHRDFCDMGASCSKTSEQRNGIVRIPLPGDPCTTKVQHQVNIRPCEENESTGLVKSCLRSCLKSLKDEKALLEIQTLIDKCE